ncbi:MAG: ATP-binding protein, partial [Ilumatobacteraceae bacterium]
EQDWLKTNRERFTRMLQGQRDLAAVSNMILSELAPLVSAQHGVFYSMTTPADGGEPRLELQAGYGFEERKHLATTFRLGEGLVGQCAKEKKRILLTDVPGDYVRISSGLGASPPLNIIVLPVLLEGTVRAVIELASFSPFSPTHQAFLDQLPESIGVVLSTIEANMLTETLLEQAQSLAEELRSQQEELRESNADLERQARLLAEQNIEAENKNLQVEESKALVEEKAGQLSLSSKYKSEFIANMSHELRTPLNSLLILAQQLEDNPEHNMTDTQVEYASVIRSSGNDLLSLLNSILDLAKIESGTFTVEMTEMSLVGLCTELRREFQQLASSHGLSYSVVVGPDAPTSLITDPQRLRQILKNLLGNAFKFTALGTVTVSIGRAHRGWSSDGALNDAAGVLAIAVADTGIGIEADQCERIFEAFDQGDGSTSRLYGGTGLGLSISRELAGLLGGEIAVTSTVGAGSVFTLFLPLAAAAAATVAAPDVPQPTPAEAVDDWVSTHPGLRAPSEVRAGLGRSLAGQHVMVVDDDFRNLFAMTALLERGEATVTLAESGQEAIDALVRAPNDIDIVLMDIMMPGMDGYATMRAIRELDQFVDLTIIAVTGKSEGGERDRCLDAGANGYIPKPISTDELLAAIVPWLRPPGRGAMRDTP